MKIILAILTGGVSDSNNRRVEVNDIEKLTETVNRSGFPLQIGLVNLIHQTGESHGWKVLCTEHAWRNEMDHANGFIDIVLEDRSHTSIMVVECKRVLESSWIFLVDNSVYRERSHAKLWVSNIRRGNVKHFNWFDATLDPPSPESAFCAVPGQDKKSRPMLERVAGNVVSATEALAVEEQKLLTGRELDALRMYVNVIVTTATLKICSFSPENISLHDGKVSEPGFTEVPYVRFRKQLSVRTVRSINRKSLLSHVLGAVAKAKEHTVFVVNSGAFEQFLKEWEVSNNSLRPLM